MPKVVGLHRQESLRPEGGISLTGVPRLGVPRLGVPRLGVPRPEVPRLGTPWKEQGPTGKGRDPLEAIQTPLKW